jgi:peptide-methionine (S)-S-oxide reductase
MTWRFVAVCVAVAVLGFSVDARAQNPEKTAAPADQENKAAPEATKAAPEATKGTPDAANSTPEAAKAGDDAANSTNDTAKPATPKGKSKKNGTRSKTSALLPDNSSSPESRLELATFGAGCFWHVEHTFEMLPGVVAAVSGYAGGDVPNPSYEMVHEGDTGHAEVVMVQYDPEVITYEQLLKVFWSNHDPTTPNRQGPDVGTQYRSIILYHNEAQRKAALESYRDLVKNRVFRYPIVTQLVPLRKFYRAEEYHQDYYGGKPQPTVSRKRKAPVSHAKVKKAPSASKTASAPATEDQADAPAPAAGSSNGRP